MRIKLSFEDIKLLFNYLDVNGVDYISYDEFTMLLEERWRGIDPSETIRNNKSEKDRKKKLRES